MIPLPLLLTFAPGVHVRVSGDARLRFGEGKGVSLAAAATLARNAEGLLADAAGRPVLPVLKPPVGVLAVATDGTVRVAGRSIGRLFLAKPDGELGHPGDPSFALLSVGGASSARPPVVKGGTATVSIRASSELEGDRVLLRDVADLMGDPATVARLGAVDLGALPSVGVRRSLGSWTVRAALRTQGFPDGMVNLNYPPDATVARKSQTIDVETLVAEATAKAREAAGEDATLALAPGGFAAPVGPVELSAVASRTGSLVLVTVTVKVGAWSRATPVRFSVRSAPEKTEGVRAGDAVRVRVERNGAVVETDGRAKTPGRVGDTVQIATADGAVLTATVTAAGRVEVRL